MDDERFGRVVEAVGASAAGGVGGGLLVAFVQDGTLSANAVIAVATVLLAGVTWVYVREIRRQRMAEAERWDEDRRARKHERSEEAAERAREMIFEVQVRPGSGTPESVVAACDRIWQTLEHLAPLIDDADLRDRMKATQVLAWTATWSEQSLRADRINLGLLTVHVRHAVEQLNHAIGNHLTGEDLPAWPADLPRYRDAQPFVWAQCRDAED